MIADHGNDVRRAEEHVAEAHRIVHTQKGLLIHLKAAGVDASGAERRLRLYEMILRRFEEHRNALKAKDRNVLKAEGRGRWRENRWPKTMKKLVNSNFYGTA